MSEYSAALGPERTYSRPLFRREFHIAIICALPLEYDAAALLIDEFWDQDDKQYGRTSGDPNTYRNGRIGMHNVVLMLLPSMGKVASAASAGSLRTSYPGIRLAFLVGVCGGVPGIQEMVLGDVVVSDDLVQYDFGRQYPGQFVAKDTIQVFLRAQSKDVRSILAYFKTEAGRKDLQDDTAKHLKSLQNAAVAKHYACSYEYPGSTEDRLFAASYRHKHREPSTCNLCRGDVELYCENAAGASCAELGCDESWLVPRQRLDVHGPQKQLRNQRTEVFIGRVASADKVMKSGEDRDRVAKQYNLIAFEMEGAGLWDEIPTIVVKGICDYADSHKNKSWQPFAAATAAAVTKSILNRYMVADCADLVLRPQDGTQRKESDSSSPSVEELSNVQSSALLSKKTMHMNHWECLQEAVFQFERALSSKNCQSFQKVKAVPNATSVLVFTAQLDARNRERKGASISSRFHALLQSVRDFSAAIESSSLYPPGIPVRIWASIKLTIIATFRLASHYETLSKLFMNLGTLCPQLLGYDTLYSDSIQLQESLAKFYASIIRCCTDVIGITQRQWYEGLFGIFWDSFEREFEPHTDEVRRYSKHVEYALWYAKSHVDQPGEERQSQKRNVITKGVLAMTGFRSKRESGTGKESNWELMVEERRRKERRQQLLDSLSSYDYLTPLKQGRRMRHTGTAEWLFDTEEFGHWANSRTSTVLWCSGKIGSGKTILTASVVDKVLTQKRDRDVFVSFFFVRFDDNESLKTETILKSILCQVLSAEETPDRKGTFLEKLENTSLTEPGQIVEILSTEIERMATFYIIIDGLDECQKQDRQSLLDTLLSLFTVRSTIKIFLSGRESVSREVEKRFPDFRHLSMDCGSVQAEISTYIEGTVQERLQCEDLIVGDPGLIEEVKEALKNGADGMFLWVAFQIDALCCQHCDDDIRKAIGDLPKDLTETFQRALRRINVRHNEDVASRSFRWIAAAKRPLSIEELKEVLFIEIGQEYSRPGRRPNGIHNISSWCENLVHVDEEKRIVQFAHHTVKQFLIEKNPQAQLDKFHFDIEEADHYLGEICVTYLNFNDFNTAVAQRASQRTQPQPQIRPTEMARSALESEQRSRKSVRAVTKLALGNRKQPSAVNNMAAPTMFETKATMVDVEEPQHPFLNYASSNMILHTRAFEKEKSVMWDCWKEMVIYGNGFIRYPWGVRCLSKNHLEVLKWGITADHKALVILIYTILEDSDNETSHLALCEAANYGALDLVKALLHAGANVDGTRRARTPLDYAVTHGHLELVNILIGAGASVNAPQDIRTPLHHAAAHGHLDIVNTLIDAGANVHAVYPTNYGDEEIGVWGINDAELPVTPLYEALHNCHPDVVNRLLAAGSQLNLPEFPPHIALRMAAKCGIVSIVDAALSAVTDMGHLFTENGGWGALFQACMNGHLEIPQRILRAAANLGLDQSVGQEGLKLAAKRGYLEVFDALKSAGVDAKERLTGHEIRPTLVGALKGEFPGSVERLLAAGVSVNETDPFCGDETALEMAAGSGRFDVVDMLLDAGISPNRAGMQSQAPTALHKAVESRNLAIVERLLAAGATVDARTMVYQTSTNTRKICTPLDMAFDKLDLDIIDTLHKAGARGGHWDHLRD